MKIHNKSWVRALGSKALPLAALALWPATAAHADNLQTVLAGSHVQRLASGGVSVLAEELVTGYSFGQVSQINYPDFPVLAADDLNLGSYFARSSTSNPNWDILLGNWWDINGAGVDFFVFDVGGNDSIQVAPIFAGGLVGQPTSVQGWTSTGHAVVSGPNKGQTVYGLAFKSSVLKNANGSPLAPGQQIEGVRVISPGIDGASFAAINPLGVTNNNPTGEIIRVLGQPRKWSPMEIALVTGPELSELDTQPNPFLDYRLEATFIGPQGENVTVPGFFDGNGRGLGAGRVWKVRFTPPSTGNWTARIFFRQGTNVAISTQLNAGAPTAMDGQVVNFDVQGLDASAEGFHRKGMLRYVGDHYLRFDNGDWFIKGGTNSPENLLAYFAFDDVADSGNMGILHRYIPHRNDWKQGDPDWNGATTGEDSRGLIGALNYLSSQGVNSVYFLPMNLGGDGQDVSPFVGQANTNFDKTHYDISRMRQWNEVFEHAQRKGIQLHVVLAETEFQNENWFDGGNLGNERKLFFRELIARFGHHNAIKWNLSEENDFSVQKLKQFANYIDALDSYDHPIAVHNNPNDLSDYSQLTGYGGLDSTSCQFAPDQGGAQVQTLRFWSLQAGHKWVVEMDENTPASTGLQPNNADDLRKRTLYDVYFSGGAGIEWYFGYQPNPIGGDVDVEDFRTREPMWKYMRYARTFMQDNLPFVNMWPDDSLVTGESGAYGGAEVFHWPGQHYAVYYPNAISTGVLDLNGHSGVQFEKRWFNPRSGQFAGSTQTVQGGGSLNVGPPPFDSSQDWVLWLKRK